MNKLKNIIAFVNSNYIKIALLAIVVILFDEFPPIR